MHIHPHCWQIALMKCPFLLKFWVTPVKKPWPLKVLKRTSSPGWASNPATLSQRRRQSWRNSSRRMLTSGERLMKWPNDTSDRPAPTKASCWRWTSACPLWHIEGFCFWVFLSCQFRICKLCLACFEISVCGIYCCFQRILSLETLRERNNQQLLVKEQELETLRLQLTARGGEVSMLDMSLQLYAVLKKKKNCTWPHMKIYVYIKKKEKQWTDVSLS